MTTANINLVHAPAANLNSLLDRMKTVLSVPFSVSSDLALLGLDQDDEFIILDMITRSVLCSLSVDLAAVTELLSAEPARAQAQADTPACAPAGI